MTTEAVSDSNVPRNDLRLIVLAALFVLQLLKLPELTCLLIRFPPTPTPTLAAAAAPELVVTPVLRDTSDARPSLGTTRSSSYPGCCSTTDCSFVAPAESAVAAAQIDIIRLLTTAVGVSFNDKLPLISYFFRRLNAHYCGRWRILFVCVCVCVCVCFLS